MLCKELYMTVYQKIQKEEKTMKRLIAFLLTLVMTVALFAVPGSAEESGSAFSEWNPEAPALKALIEYVEDVTNEASPNYIPPADRIATFDMDGTLMGELYPTYLEVMLLTERILKDPSYQPDEEMLEFGRMTRDHALDKSFPSDYDYQFSYHQAKAFAGMTLNEYADFITRFLVHEADGFEGMTYASAFYLPMVEVVEYLQDHGFKCFVVSGSDRFIVRTFIEGMLDIPYENIIGSDTALAARDQGDTDGIEYVFTGDDTLVRTDRLIIKDLKTNKVLQIAQEIGRQPVLSFGNSSGDVSMNNYALLNNRYRSAAFMLVADDEVRDYGNPAKHDELTEKWQGMGYQVISMRDDWKTIYGEEVKKTGEFHWLENYADDGQAVSTGSTGKEGSRGKKVYFAAPLFSQSEKDYNLLLTKVLEDHGYEVFLPQRDGYLAAELAGKTEDELTQLIFEKDFSEVMKADIVFMLLDGRVPDEGACVELGIAYANGKRCYGVKTDARSVEINMDLNPMITGCFIKLFKNFDGDKLVEELEQYLSENEL